MTTADITPGARIHVRGHGRPYVLDVHQVAERGTYNGVSYAVVQGRKVRMSDGQPIGTVRRICLNDYPAITITAA